MADPTDEPDPVQQEFTWEGKGEDPSPTPTPTTSAPDTSDATPDWAPYLDIQQGKPIDLDITPGQPGQSSSTTGKQSVSTSHSGIAGGPKAADDLFANADKKAEADIAPYRAEHDQQIESERKHSDQLQNAVVDESLYQKGFENLNRKLLERQQDFYEHSAALEQQIQQQGQAVRAQYIGEYREQLAGVRQLIAQSGNPLESLSRPEALGLGLAQFAQGFLAAKGINIDVSGQVDRWVDRSIKQHQQLIENARGAANDTLSLYGIARQASQDDYEARQRYRGFVIEGLKTAIQANAARFNSGVASARADQSVAKLQLEQDATERQMGDTLYGKYIQTRQMEKDEAHYQGQLKLQKDAQALEWYKAQTARQAATAKAQKGTGRLLIKDPEQKYLAPDGRMVNAVPLDPQTQQPAKGYRAVNEARWEVDPSLPDAVKSKLSEEAGSAQSEWGDYQDKMARVLKLRAEVHQEMESQKGGATGFLDLAGYTSDKMRRRYSPHYDEYRAAVDEMIAAKLLAETGKAQNEKEQDNMRARYPDEKVLANHDGAQLFIDSLEESRQKFERRMQKPGIIKVAPDDPQHFELADTASPGIAQSYQNSKNGGEPVLSPVDRENGAAREKGNVGVAQTVSPTYARWFNANGGSGNTGSASSVEPEWAQHFDSLAKIALGAPDEIKRLSIDDPDSAKTQAVTALQRASMDESLPAPRRYFASYLANEIAKNPEGLMGIYNDKPDYKPGARGGSPNG